MNLLNAIRMLDIDDDEVVHLAKRPQQSEAPMYSVKELRRSFDLRAIEVRKINPWHYRYAENVNWEFVIEHWEDVTGCKDYSKPKPKLSREQHKAILRAHMKGVKSCVNPIDLDWSKT